jgi:transposase
LHDSLAKDAPILAPVREAHERFVPGVEVADGVLDEECGRHGPSRRFRRPSPVPAEPGSRSPAIKAAITARIDGIDADIAVLDAQIEAHLAPFDNAVERLDEIPGIGPVAAAVIIAEIGVDMTWFPTAGHLCSWAKFSPGIKSSAGKNKSNGSTGHGDRYLARVLGEAAPIAGRTDTFLGERYRLIARRRG